MVKRSKWQVIKNKPAAKKQNKQNKPWTKLINAIKNKPSHQSTLEQLRQSRPTYWSVAEWDNIILWGDPDGETTSIECDERWLSTPHPAFAAAAPAAPAPVAPVVPAPVVPAAPVPDVPAVPTPAPAGPANPFRALTEPATPTTPPPGAVFERFAMPKPGPSKDSPICAKPAPFVLRPSKMGPVTKDPIQKTPEAPSLLSRIADNVRRDLDRKAEQRASVASRTRSKNPSIPDRTGEYLPSRRSARGSKEDS